MTNQWKPAIIASALAAAIIYAFLVIHEISLHTRLGAERRARTAASRALVEEEVLFGTIWAHQRHPPDATWCPDYSPSFQKGCADAVANGLARERAGGK